MNSLAEIFRANVGLMISSALVVGGSFVLTLVGLIMKSGGVSLRPMVFIGLLLALVAIPQWVFHLALAVRPHPRPAATTTGAFGQSSPAPASASGSAGLSVERGRFADRDRVFGPGIVTDAVQDIRQSFVAIVPGAEAAELAMTMEGETILVAQFARETEAWQAAAAYARVYDLTDREGSLETGWRGRARPTGLFVELLGLGRTLFVWTAPTREAADRRRAASTAAVVDASQTAAVTARREQFMASLPPANAATAQPFAALAPPAEPLIAGLAPLRALLQSNASKAAGIILLGAIYVLWFFKGAAWASRSPARPGVAPVTAAELATRLQFLNTLDVPFRVEAGDHPKEFYATWNYADAKWVDLARARGLKRTFQVRLVLDEARHTVRATDFVSRYDWSAGRGGAQFEWQAMRGIVFFQIEQGRVFGVQLDEDGRPKPKLSYAYRFNLQDLKGPLSLLVNHAGWDWAPTLALSPSWLQ